MDDPFSVAEIETTIKLLNPVKLLVPTEYEIKCLELDHFIYKLQLVNALVSSLEEVFSPLIGAKALEHLYLNLETNKILLTIEEFV